MEITDIICPAQKTDETATIDLPLTEMPLDPEPEDEEGALYEHHRITVDKGQEMLRIDKYLQMHLQSISRNKIQLAAKAGCIVVNDKPVKSNYRVKPLDVISVLLPEPPHEVEVLPEEIPLTIVYEDEDVMVVNKPAGLVVHPGHGNYTGTLLNGLLFYLQNKTTRGGEPAQPYLVHRIDKDTSGLLLVAKNEEAQVVLAKQFFVHSIERKYNALVWGDFEEAEGTIDANLERSAKDRRVMAVCGEERGKHAVTHWKVMQRFGYVTLIECVLETGRTHQIRAHLKHIGHPLFSDAAYGGNAILKGTTFSKYRQFVENCFRMMPRQALHARILGFEHPFTNQHLHFECPPPQDFESVLEKWANYSRNQNEQ